jgi:hypothetical protein
MRFFCAEYPKSLVGFQYCHDAAGIFKIHIEFDDAGVARIIAKDTKKGPIVVLDAAPRPEKQHQHSGTGG